MLVLVAEGAQSAHGSRNVRVAGALLSRGHPRLVRIGDYHIEVNPRGTILIISNRDVPGVIGRVGTALGNAGINIGSYHQSRRSKPGAHALAAITVDTAPPASVLEELRKAPGIQSVRLVDFGD